MWAHKEIALSDFSARTGVLRSDQYGNDGGDAGQSDEDRITMDTAASSRTAGDQTGGSSGSKLDFETFAANPALPTDRKWGIRFDANGTVTLVLGMRDYGQGLYTAYFAGLVAARLGVPFPRMRVYYSAMRPAVRITPQPTGLQLRESDPAPVAKAAAEIIEEICGGVIENGRRAFAAKADVDATEIGFDRRTGDFFTPDLDRCSNILEIARDQASASDKFAKNGRRSAGVHRKPDV